jgi:beta-glucosidase
MSRLLNNKYKIDEYKKRASEIVKEMTIEEKCNQMLYKAPAIKRLGMNAYNWWNEGLHGVARAGVATIFPQAIGLAASFDEELMERVGDAISTEARAKFNMQQQFGDMDIYKGLTLWAPNVNIFRDPRWGRGHETYGEDPYLTSRLAVSFINGLQGNDENYLKVAACAKHFAVHSGPEDQRHSFNAEVSKQDLHETYLPAFEACVKEAKVETVMGAYNRTNGEPCCGSKLLLKDILRDQWGFDGHVVSDCWAIKDFHEYHHVTEGPLQSVALAVSMGCDLNCGNMFLYLQEAVSKGLLTEDQITKAVVRLLTTRMKLGLFDDSDKVTYNALTYLEVDSKKMQEENLDTARKTLVLLKNDKQLLPLDKSKIKNVGVIGPNANNRRALVGNYEGTSSRYVTILEGIQDYLGEDTRVLYSEGCHLFKDKIESLAEANDRLAEVKAVCQNSDVVIACMGLDSGLEGEEGDQGNHYASGDKPDLKLPGLQEDVIKAIYESGKPVVLVLLSGSAVAINWAQEHIPAIIQGWYPGAQGGRAIAEAIFGEFSPEGKLPVTFYRSTEELPDFTDYSMKNRTYRYMKGESLYPFGYGLSYTDFTIDEVQLDTETITERGINIQLRVTNNGKVKGRETIQVYVKSDKPGTPNPQLKTFTKVELLGGQNNIIQLHLPVQAFSLCDEEGNRIVEQGSYSVYVGDSQPDSRSIELTGKVPFKLAVVATKSIEVI